MTPRSDPRTPRVSSGVRLFELPAPLERKGSAEPAGLGAVYMAVFDLICGERRPLTLRQIARRMTMPEDGLGEVLDELCQLHLLRRLNTVIESYTGPAVPFS